MKYIFSYAAIFLELFHVRIPIEVLNPRLSFKTKSKTDFILFLNVLVKKYIIDNWKANI